MLSRKYYRQIAEIFGKSNVSQKTIVLFQEMALRDNPNFNPMRFGDAVEKARLEKVA